MRIFISVCCICLHDSKNQIVFFHRRFKILKLISTFYNTKALSVSNISQKLASYEHVNYFCIHCYMHVWFKTLLLSIFLFHVFFPPCSYTQLIWGVRARRLRWCRP